MTKSVLPAIPVHIAGDALFFTLIWPHDAQRPLVWTHGADPLFWMHVAQLAIFGTLSVLAFVQLRRVTRRSAHCPKDSMSATTARQASTEAEWSLDAI